MTNPRSFSRILVNALLDAVAGLLAVPLSAWLAAPGVPVPPGWIWGVGAATLLIAGLPFRLSRQYWRYAGIGDLVGVAGASVAGAALFALLLGIAEHKVATPTFPLIHAMVLLVLLGAPRVAYRLMQGRPRPGREEGVRSVLLVGGGEGADLFLRALAAARGAARLRPVGLLTLAARQTGRRIQGVPILGEVSEAEAVLERLAQEGRAPETLVITDDLAPPVLAALLDSADTRAIPVRRAPRPTTLQAPAAAPRPIELQPLVIEDLLDRPEIALDRDGMARLVQGRRVLVTGAGGTIGSELARQVSRLGPEEILLLDNGEYALWQIDLELAETCPDLRRRAVIADVRDATRIRAVIEAARPDLVFHAAALKHVPMVEANPLEGIMTNVVGTQNVADAARAAGCRAMVFISTDKAVNPTSLMGATKRLAEMYCQALDIAACQENGGSSGGGSSGSGSSGGGMRCVTVRFGNVLGSTGSVVPLFRRQLERGGPLTVTHPDMQRYFMTVPEAVGLVLQASVLGVNGATLPGGRDGGIFVLDMGAPVKIVDLARRMIRLAGLVPDRDVPIRFTGLRPGEKLYEELFHGREPPVPTGHPGLLMAAPRTADPAIVGRAIEEIASACRAGQVRLALAHLSRLVPEFEHRPEGGAAPAASHP